MPIDERSRNKEKIAYDSGEGHWHRLTPRVWIAPNGDAVSIRSMSLDLRVRLNVGDEFDRGPNVEAIRALRTIPDR